MGSLLAGAALVIAWPIVLSRFGHDDVYRALGPFAVLVVALVLSFGRRERVLPRAGSEWRRDIAIGLGCGGVMTVGTYAAYAVAARFVPGLARSVRDLYRTAGTDSLAIALLSTVAAIVAEEVLWRGPLLRTLERRTGRSLAIAISLGTYVLAQTGSRSVIVALAALVCGSIWLAERLWTRSMVAPLLSHLIWTLIVIHLWPVTAV